MRKVLAVLLVFVVLSGGCISGTAKGGTSSSPSPEVSPSHTAQASSTGTSSTATTGTSATPARLSLEPVSTPITDGLYVEVDPNLELLSIVFRLAKPQWYSYHDPNFQGVSDPSYPYLKDIDDHFGRYRDSKAVRMALNLSSRGFGQEEMLLLAIYMDTHSREALRKITSETNVSEAEVNAFVSAVLEFSKESDFKTFYTGHRRFYREVVGNFSRKNPDIASILPRAEGFFRLRLNPVRILLEPSMVGYYEAFAIDADEGVALYIGLGMEGVVKGRPFFSTGRGLGGVNAPTAIAWLMAFPLFNRAFSPYSSNLSAYGGLYENVKEVMKEWGISNVQEMVVATSTAAFVTYYLNSTYGPETAEGYMWWYATGGLYFLPEFSRVTSGYMKAPNRDFNMLVRELVQTTGKVYAKTNGGRDLSRVIPTPTVLDFARKARKTGMKIFYNPKALDEARTVASLMQYLGVGNYTLHTILKVSSSDLRGNIVLIVDSDDLLYKLIENQLAVEFNGSTVHSRVTGKAYHGPTMFAEVLQNPWDPSGLLYIEVTQDWGTSSSVPVHYLMHYVVSQGHGILEIR